MSNEIDQVSKFLSILHSIPLRILAALAVAGYATLFLPEFGGAELSEFRKDWGWACWLGAVVFSILAVACAIDLFSKHISDRARRRRKYDSTRYHRVYKAMYAELRQIHITTSTATLALYLGHRVKDAWRKVRNAKRKNLSAFDDTVTVFDKRETSETGEVEYGGRFPISTIDDIAQYNLTYCDEELIRLLKRAIGTRMNDGTSSCELTADDVSLIKHIQREHDKLKRIVTRR